jgi:pre-mRNA-splicing factor ATP-dependent RNA helicase DHX15/PRP43
MTDGMLLREAILDPNLNSYNVLILDEVHERSVNSDVLMALVKEIMIQRKKSKISLKLVIMSATLDMHKFAKYYGGNSIASVSVEGRTFPIDIFHSLSP